MRRLAEQTFTAFSDYRYNYICGRLSQIVEEAWRQRVDPREIAPQFQPAGSAEVDDLYHLADCLIGYLKRAEQDAPTIVGELLELIAATLNPPRPAA